MAQLANSDLKPEKGSSERGKNGVTGKEHSNLLYGEGICTFTKAWIL